jgi:hypothetical protein
LVLLYSEIDSNFTISIIENILPFLSNSDRHIKQFMFHWRSTVYALEEPEEQRARLLKYIH